MGAASRDRHASKESHNLSIQKSTIIPGADHFGLSLKNALREHGYEVADMGVESDEPIDYPDIGFKAAEAVGRGEFARGIPVCGTGADLAGTATNKVPGVRTVCVMDPYTAERTIASNNAHIITFGQQIVGPAVARMLAGIWLHAEFHRGRSAPKVAR